MANRKISDLTALTTPASGDYLPIVDISEAAAADKNKRITVGELLRGVPDGTPAAPGIAFENNPNTGLFRSGNNQISIVTNSNERLVVDSSGNVGVNTASPASTLDVNGNVTITDKIIHGGDTNTAIRFPAADTVSIETAGSEAARIDSSGRLLVGTSTVPTVAGSQFRFNVSGTTFAESGILQVRYESVVLGPTLVFAKARGTAASPSIVQDDDELGKIRFYGYDSNDFSPYGAEIAVEVDGTPGPNDMPGRLVFSTTANGASSPTERLRITSDGKVGIGTTSPASALHINGDITIADKIIHSGDTNTAIRFPANDTVSIETSGSEAARIDSSGRLLVGTSTARQDFFGQTYYSPQVQIETTSTDAVGAFGAALSITKNGSDNRPSLLLFVKTRASANGGSGIVNSDDLLGQISFSGNDGAGNKSAADILALVDGTPGANDMPGRLVFRTTADGASSPTERMKITSNGHLQVANNGNYDTGAPTRHQISESSFSEPVLMLRATDSSSYFQSMLFIVGSRNTTNSSWSFLRCRHSGTDYLYIRDNGNVQNANNSYGALSDAKLKENIVDANSQWDDIKYLRVRKYNFIEGQTHTQIGVVAQEVETVSPGLVTESPDRDEEGNDLGTTTKSVNYSVLYMKAVKALQEAMERIEVLEASNTDLLARVSALESA